MPRTKHSFERLPGDVTETLAAIGRSVRTARINRRMTAEDLAARLAVTRPTLRRLEAGKPGVSLATLLSALWIFGLLDLLKDALAPSNDELGLALAESRLPRRVRGGRGELDDL